MAFITLDVKQRLRYY